MGSAASAFRIDEIGSWGWVYWLGVLVSIAIAAVNLYIGLTTEQSPLIAVGISFLVGVVLFFTNYWEPVLYLVGILHVAILGVIWVLAGMQFLTIGLVNGVLSLSLAAIALWLYYIEEWSTLT